MFFGGGGRGGFPFGGMGMDDDDDDGGFPFGGGMGGMPGRGREKKEVDNKKLYEVLGLDNTATME